MKCLCKVDFSKKDNLKLAFLLSKDAKFICKSCGRVSSDKSALCNPTKAKKLSKTKNESLPDNPLVKDTVKAG